MKKILNYILILIIAGLAVYTFVLKSDLKQSAAEGLVWYGKQKENSIKLLKQIGVSQEYATEVKKLNASNKDLQKAIKANKEKISFISKLNATLKAELLVAQTEEDTSSESPRRIFGPIIRNGFSISGRFDVVSPFIIYIDKLTAVLDLELILTQDKALNWNTYVSSPNKNLKFNKITPTIKKYEPTFWENVKYGGGVYGGMGHIGIGSLLGYKDNFILLGFDTKGGSVGFFKTFTF